MTHYNLAFLPKFQEDLNEISYYIAVILKNPTAAKKLIDEIEVAIDNRLMNPLSFQTYHSKKRRQYPYYPIYVRNYIIFYVVIENTMEVRRILYNKRNISEIL